MSGLTTLKEGRCFFLILNLKNFMLVWRTSGTILLWLGYGWTRLEGCYGCKLDKNCSSVVFYFVPTVKKIRSIYVVVVVDLFLFISCMQRCVLMGAHPLADYDKRIADS